jgi:hypothetical protein
LIQKGKGSSGTYIPVAIIYAVMMLSQIYDFEAPKFFGTAINYEDQLEHQEEIIR